MKKWEILKTCKDIIDEQEEGLIAKMSMKDKMKESVLWKENEVMKYNEWKARNIRLMSLKESSLKETTKSGLFEKFCIEKGLRSKKGLWENDAENEIEENENVLRELKAERKAAKSRKKKIALYKKCRAKKKSLSW
jgi:hypothetical protein